MTSSAEKIWQVRLPDGTIWIPPDSQPGSPRASWIYARSTADMFATKLGGVVIEVSRHQHGKVLDREIGEVLAKPQPRKRPRKLGHTDRRERAQALAEYVPLSTAGRGALETARATADAAEYDASIRKLTAALPSALWVGNDNDHWYVQEAQPVWIADDPAGEDPANWNRIESIELARILVEDT